MREVSARVQAICLRWSTNQWTMYDVRVYECCIGLFSTWEQYNTDSSNEIDCDLACIILICQAAELFMGLEWSVNVVTIAETSLAFIKTIKRARYTSIEHQRAALKETKIESTSSSCDFWCDFLWWVRLLRFPWVTPIWDGVSSTMFSALSFY